MNQRNAMVMSCRHCGGSCKISCTDCSGSGVLRIGGYNRNNVVNLSRIVGMLQLFFTAPLFIDLVKKSFWTDIAHLCGVAVQQR